MNPFKRKSRMKKLLESLEHNDALKGVAITAAESAVAGATSRRQAEKLSEALGMRGSGRGSSGSSGSLKSKVKSGLMLAAGAAAAVATSASISSRRRHETEA